MAISNIGFKFSVMNEVIKKYFDSLYLGSMKDIIEWNESPCDFAEKINLSFVCFEQLFSVIPLLWIESDGKDDAKVKTSGAAFVLNQHQVDQGGFSCKCATDKIENESNIFCEVLKLTTGSGCESLSTFYLKKVNHFVKIDDSVQIISGDAFCHDDSLAEIVFSPQNNLRQIQGFEKCVSLPRTEIPSSVETITEYGFSGCISLNEIIFSSHIHLRQISGFQQCPSFCRIEIARFGVIPQSRPNVTFVLFQVLVNNHLH
jgi:hypothetical protein